MAKYKFRATFSNGETITRSSDKLYKTAAALFSKETGKMESGTSAFSTGRAKAVWRVKRTIHRYGMGYREAQAAKAYNREVEKHYREEVVNVEVL